MGSTDQLNDIPENLYKLYENSDLYIVQPQPEDSSISYEGKNNYQTIIVCENINSNDKALLNKILEALGINLPEVMVLDVAQEESAGKSLLDTVAATGFIVSFGVEPARLGWQKDDTKYTAIEVEGRQFLFADTLSNIGSDTTLKKQLWTALKQMYKV